MIYPLDSPIHFFNTRVRMYMYIIKLEKKMKIMKIKNNK